MNSQDIPNPLSKSKLYTPLLVSLLLQNFTPQTKTAFKCNYDYIVVGAGTAGSVVASRLSENPYVKVLVLEAGPSPPVITEVPAITGSLLGSYIDWNRTTVPQKHLYNRVLPTPLGKTVGGSGILSFMYNIRGNKRNFDDWAAGGATGWDYNSVLKYFIKMEDYKIPESFNPKYHGLKGPLTIELPRFDSLLKSAVYQAAIDNNYYNVDPNAASQLGFFNNSGTVRDGRRCSTSKAYLLPAEQRLNLDIIANAFVKKVIIKNGRAIGIEFDFEGQTFQVTANKEIILSAGAIHTPQLLMLSGIGPRQQLQALNIPVVADLPVGGNLQDHTIFYQSYTVKKDLPVFDEAITKCSTIQEYITKRTGLLTSLGTTFFSALVTNDENSPPETVPDNELAFIYGNLLDQGVTWPLLTCGVLMLKTRSRGTVKLNSSNVYDSPLIDPNYFDDERDLEDTIAGLNICDKFVTSEAFKGLDIKLIEPDEKICNKFNASRNKFLECLLRNQLTSPYHLVGTAKMGNPRDPSTVVDPELRVKGVKNLRVVDGSIMPQGVTANSFIAIVMIAEKASDIITKS